MKCVVSLVVLFLVGALGQESSAQNTGPTDLELQQFIRIVEPVIYPIQRLQGERWDWRELSTSCGLGGVKILRTEMGQAWIRCEPDRPQSIGFHGGNEPERIWANMTIAVTVQGFNTQEHLCWLSSDDRDTGTSDVRRFCSDGNRSDRHIRAVVIARFTMKTTLLRYDEKEAKELTAYYLRDKQAVTSGRSGDILDWRPVEAGEVKSREVVISPVKYEFLSGK